MSKTKRKRYSAAFKAWAALTIADLAGEEINPADPSG